MSLVAPANRPSRASIAQLLSALALLAVVISLFGPRLIAHGTDMPISNPTDFRTFYCAGEAVRSGADPYRVQPLTSCENHTALNFVWPAPLPPYALAAFGLFSMLPFAVASMLWFALALVAFSATIVIVSRLVALPLWVIAAALVGADAIASILIGQIVPFVVCALMAAALALRTERYAIAAVALGVAAIEPHIALPAALAAFVILPRMRFPLIAVAATLATASYFAVGLATCVEYVARVVPAHAHSEVTYLGAQYSFTSLLNAFGVPEDFAVRAGGYAYAAMTILSVALALRIVKSTGDRAVCVLLPIALAPLGGVFVHIHQMAAAVPFALSLFSKRRASLVLFFAVFALAVPWESFAETSFVTHLYSRGQTYRVPHISAPRPDALAEEPEAAYLRDAGNYYDGRTRSEKILWKLPTWYALLVLLSLAFKMGFPSRSRVGRAPQSPIDFEHGEGSPKDNLVQ